MREAKAMGDPAQTPRVQACAYAAIVMVSLAVTLDAPIRLMGMPGLQTLPYAACFIGVVWMSSFLIPSTWKLSLTVVLATLVWTSIMQICIQTFELKETAVALLPLTEGESAYMLLAFVVGAMLLLGPMLLRRSYPTPDLLRLARALLISWTGLLALIAVLSLVGLSRFFDPLKILLTPYVYPLMASALVVLLWRFIVKDEPTRRPPVG